MGSSKSRLLVLFTLTWAGFAPAQTWTQTSAPSQDWRGIASSADGSKLAATVWSGLIYISTNSGATWEPSSAPSQQWAGVASSANGNQLIALSSPGGIYTSTNSGVT